jgi:hypothetical protein
MQGSRVAEYRKLIYNAWLTWIVVAFLLICAFIAITTSSIAIDKEKEHENDTINTYVVGGQLDVDGEIITRAIIFNNDVTNKLSVDGIEVVALESVLMYNTLISFATSDIELDEIRIYANRIGNLVNVYVSEWEGTCFNESSILRSKESLPIEFIMSEDDVSIRTYSQSMEIVNDSTKKRGATFVDANGKINIISNPDDLNENWSGECSSEAVSISFPLYL